MKPGAPLRLAVLGQPVQHSQSPRIHRLFGQQLGLKVEYERMETPPEALAAQLQALRQAGGTGANLTVPLKHIGLDLCSQLDEAARQAAAVNTLKWANGGWQGFNTDGAGFMLDLERLGLAVRARRILIVGAGGAVAGLLSPLLAAGPEQLTVINRSAERARALAERFSQAGLILGGGMDLAATLPPHDLLIQATSAGHGQASLPLERSWLKPQAACYDLNYGPAHEPFAQWAIGHDLPVHDGLGMLVGQAALAFAIWSGKQPQLEPVLNVLRAG